MLLPPPLLTRAHTPPHDPRRATCAPLSLCSPARPRPRLLALARPLPHSLADAQQNNKNAQAGSLLSTEVQTLSSRLKKQHEQQARARKKVSLAHRDLSELERAGHSLRAEHGKLAREAGALQRGVEEERVGLERAAKGLGEVGSRKAKLRAAITDMKARLVAVLKEHGEPTDHLEEGGDLEDDASVTEGGDLSEAEAEAAARGSDAAGGGSMGGGGGGDEAAQSPDVDDNDDYAYASDGFHQYETMPVAAREKIRATADGVDLSYGKFDPSVFRQPGTTVTGITPREELENGVDSSILS